MINLGGLFKLEGFEKIVVKSVVRGRKETKPMVKLQSGGRSNYRQLCINGAAMEAAGFKFGDKVDLYSNGSSFALEKSISGMYNIRRLNAQSSSGCIGSSALCREISIRANDASEFNATAMSGILFFEPVKEE